ncbi:hypothetical protein [Sulfolobus tengchongensis spindle-shaped virus 3]|nr:hypothetical protein [Sulfolobus tengchongensis spindle-shaped virus 3]
MSDDLDYLSLEAAPQDLEKRKDAISLALNVCNSLTISSHPISVYNSLLLFLPTYPHFKSLFEKVKKVLESTNNKAIQRAQVIKLCIALFSNNPANTNLVIDTLDTSDYNIEAVVNEASNILTHLETVYKEKSEYLTKLKAYQVIIEKTKALLLRINGTMLYQEIMAIFNVNEKNLEEALHAEYFFDYSLKMLKVVGGVLEFIKAHFK